jgi:hypothetical protein
MAWNISCCVLVDWKYVRNIRPGVFGETQPQGLPQFLASPQGCDETGRLPPGTGGGGPVAAYVGWGPRRLLISNVQRGTEFAEARVQPQPTPARPWMPPPLQVVPREEESHHRATDITIRWALTVRIAFCWYRNLAKRIMQNPDTGKIETTWWPAGYEDLDDAPMFRLPDDSIIRTIKHEYEHVDGAFEWLFARAQRWAAGLWVKEDEYSPVKGHAPPWRGACAYRSLQACEKAIATLRRALLAEYPALDAKLRKPHGWTHPPDEGEGECGGVPEPPEGGMPRLGDDAVEVPTAAQRAR